MIALKITDTKKMMQTLLHSASFDQFSLQEVSASKDISLFLEGRIHEDFYSKEEIANDSSLSAREFALWGQYRELVASFIKGDKAPLSFKFVLQAPDSYMQKLLSSPEFTTDPGLVKALILTFRYENMTLTCLTGTAMRSFTMDKSLDQLWDQAIRKSLANMQIGFDEM